MSEWQPIETAPTGTPLWTKIDDGKGVRNIQRLRLSGRLWFGPRDNVYVYYTPTHWAPDAPEPPQVPA